MDNQDPQANSVPPLNFPADSPVATPSDFFPPEPPVHHSKNPFNGKIIATVLGLAVLAGGLGAGVVLVQQPQRAESLAYDPQMPALKACPSNVCQTSKFSWGGNANTLCQRNVRNPVTGAINTVENVYCCNSGTDVIVNNKCQTGCPTDTKNCNQNITSTVLTNAKACFTSTGTKMYCCAEGYTNLSGECRITPKIGVKCNTTTKYETRSYGFGCGCSVTWTCSKDAGAATKTWHTDGKCTPTFGVTLPSACGTCFSDGVWNDTCQ